VRKFKHRFQMYRYLAERRADILAEAARTAEELGIPAELRGKFGLAEESPRCPPTLRRLLSPAASKATCEAMSPGRVVDCIRELVKDYYGDEWDAVPMSTCEAALSLVYDHLFTPSLPTGSSLYRARYLAPYEKHQYRHIPYGRPFPPRYKYLMGGGAVEALLVPLVGARYENHGISYRPVALLTEVDPDASYERLVQMAELHAQQLVGVVSLGHDTPGYGYGARDEQGTPLLQKYMGELAVEFNLPYVVDNAHGFPFIGTDPRAVGADIMVYGVGEGGSLIIGREEVMASVTDALNMGHGTGWGGHGGSFASGPNDAKKTLFAQLAILRCLKDAPELLTENVDLLEGIVREEFAQACRAIREAVSITKSYNSGWVEVNYEKSWANGRMGIPIFTAEDAYAGSHLIRSGLAAMGIIPGPSCDASIFISPGTGTCDSEGRLRVKLVRYAVRGLVRVLEICARHSGYLD